MENINYIVANSLVGSFILLFIYFYIYKLYRENYMLIWASGWSILLSRYIIFDTGLISWQDSLAYIIMYQLFILCGAFFFLWGSYLFIENPHKKNLCVYCIILAILLSLIIDFISTSITQQLATPLFIGSFIGLWTGYIYITSHKLKGIGHFLVGYAFIFWNILNLTLPFLITYKQLTPICYTFGGILRLTIGIGILVAYFEKNKNALLNKEQEYRILAENAVDIIYSYQVKPVFKIKYISPAVLTITGYSPEDFYNNKKLISTLIYPADQLKFNRFILTISSKTENILIFRLLHKNNTLIWAELKCAPIYHQAEIIEWTGVIRDISTRKKLEDLAVAYERMNIVGNMAATVAHEIRNPMTTVHGYLQMLFAKDYYKNDKDKFKLMLEELDRANMIINQYLSLSKQKFCDLQKNSLDNVIQRIFPLIAATAKHLKVSIQLKLSNTSSIYLDENEIRQLLFNIVRNGLDSMPNGGSLTISTAKINNQVVLSIQDQGPGIPPEILDRIGTPFITTKENGTGLGMALCYQIAKHHHATITIDTNDKGTTFHIHFPIAK